MQTTQDNTAAFRLPENVVIVSGHEGHARLDREMAKNLGVRSLAWFDSGKEAKAYITKNKTDLVICDHKLADMDGYDFMREVRGATSTGELPVLMASMENHELEVLKAIAAGCSSYLLRPYTLGSLERQMDTAVRVGRMPEEVTTWAARLQQERERRQRAIARKHARNKPASPRVEKKHARDWCLEGNRLLQKRKWDEAMAAFGEALQLNADYAEAHEGVARAWHGKGVVPQTVEHLRKACRQYAAKDRYMEVRRCYAELARDGFRMHNPYTELAGHRFHTDDVEGGLKALRQAVMLTPEDEHVHLALAHAYHDRGDLEEAIGVLEAALETARERQMGSRAFPGAIRLLAELRREANANGLQRLVRRVKGGLQAAEHMLRNFQCI